jgi:hypothetical protein
MRPIPSQQRLSCNQKNTIVTAARLCPDQRQAWKRRLDPFAVVSHFNDQQPSRIEVQRGSSHDALDEAEPLMPAGEREHGLLAILCR